MFEHFYCYPGRIKKLRNGKDGSILEGFVKKLHQSGYARITAQKHIRAISHLIYWADKKGVPISNWSGKLILDFGSHLDWCQCPGFGRSNRMHLLNSCRLFLEHLKDTRVTTSYANESNTQDFPLFVEFCRWMRRQRGTRDSTLYNYSHSILDFLKHHGEDPCKFDADSLRQFVLERRQQSGWAAAKTCTTALRMFIRFDKATSFL